MTNRRLFVFITILCILGLLSGCGISRAVKDHIDTEAAAHDGYTRLIEQDIGDLSTDDISKTPRRVRLLVNHLLEAIYLGRESWHSIRFNVNDGPNPDTLELYPPIFPEPAEEEEPEDHSSAPFGTFREKPTFFLFVRTPEGVRLVRVDPSSGEAIQSIRSPLSEPDCIPDRRF